MAELTLIMSMSALRAVGTRLGRAPTQLSPMYALRQDEIESGVQELRQLRVIDGSGTVAAPFVGTFEALLDPISSTQVTVSETEVTAEHAVFFAASDHRAITLTTTEQGLLIRDPGPNKQIADGLTQLFGLSVMGGSALAGAVSAGEALVLAVILDEFRKMVLGELATGSAITPVTASTIRRALRDHDDNRQWILTALRSQIDEPPRAEDIDLDGALSSLVGLGWVIVEGPQIVLAGAAKETLPRMLLLRRGVHVTAAIDLGDTVKYVDYAGFSFGMHDILEIESTDDMVRFEFTSSARFVGEVAQLLLDAEALRPTPNPAPEARDDANAH